MKAIIKDKEVKLKHRGRDDWGDGGFGAGRGKRKHKGIDYEAPVDALILSPVNGTVSRLGLPYKESHLDYVEITDAFLKRHRVMYIESHLPVGTVVTVGQPIGRVQGVAAKYTTPERFMKNHVHYEVLEKDGTPINPEEYE